MCFSPGCKAVPLLQVSLNKSLQQPEPRAPFVPIFSDPVQFAILGVRSRAPGRTFFQYSVFTCSMYARQIAARIAHWSVLGLSCVDSVWVTK